MENHAVVVISYKDYIKNIFKINSWLKALLPGIDLLGTFSKSITYLKLMRLSIQCKRTIFGIPLTTTLQYYLAFLLTLMLL